MDRGAWRATVHGVAKSWTTNIYSDLTHTHTTHYASHSHSTDAVLHTVWSVDRVLLILEVALASCQGPGALIWYLLLSANKPGSAKCLASPGLDSLSCHLLRSGRVLVSLILALGRHAGCVLGVLCPSVQRGSAHRL